MSARTIYPSNRPAPRLFFHRVTWVPKPGANQKIAYLSWYRRQYQLLIGADWTVHVNSVAPVVYLVHRPDRAITVYLPADLTVHCTSVPVVPAAKTVHKPPSFYRTTFRRKEIFSHCSTIPLIKRHVSGALFQNRYLIAPYRSVQDVERYRF